MALLEQAGARPRGKRHDCPKCGGIRTLTHTEEVFFCQRCQWKGNTITLAKELGLYQRLPRPEYVRQRRARERARLAAEWLAQRVKERRLALDQAHRDYLDAIRSGHEAGPGSELGWEGMATAHETLREVRAELLALEDADAAGAFEILRHGPEAEPLLLAAMTRDDGESR
jgi:ribosomal protein L37AE/L43A